MSSLMNSIGKNSTQNIVSTVVQKNNANEEKLQQKKVGTSTPIKVLTGAAALAAIAVGGILVHNRSAAKKLTKGIEGCLNDLKGNINRLKNDTQYTSIFDPDVTLKYIDDAVGLPQKERMAKLKEIWTHISNDRDLKSKLYKSNSNIAEFPQPLQDAINAKDHVTASKLYKQYCDALFHKSETSGATIQESVEKVFGKSEIIKSHTYDTSKEFENIVTMQNRDANGYQSVIVNSKNEIYDSTNLSSKLNYSDYIPTCNVETVFVGTGKKDGKKFVTIKYPINSDKNIGNAITLLSPNGKLTQAQKDLLKVADKLTDADKNLLLELTNGSNRNRTNYDAILSFIQTIANRV